MKPYPPFNTALAALASAAVAVSSFAAQPPTAGQPRPAQQGQRGEDVPEFNVRPGYKVTLAAKDLGDDARFMAFDDKGTLYLSQPKPGVILSMLDKDGDGVYETRTKFVENMPRVHAMQFKDGWLWFAQTVAIHRARDTNGDGTADEVVTLVKDLPGERGHWWRSLLVADDGFYTSVGDSGNATAEEKQADRQKIWKYSLDGKDRKEFATGVRNTEELQFRPGTTEIWGVDHGSDIYGSKLGERPPQNQPFTDVIPPDEFNLYEEGKFYGHPYVMANRIPRLEFLERKDLVEIAAKTTIPEWNIGPHWSANCWTFLTKDHFPGHKGDAFVACRGSWNSSVKVGYRVQRIRFDEWTGKPFASQMIVGTLNPEGTKELARPVDCVEAPDGTVLFSCDVTRRIYRISRSGEGAQAGAGR